MFFSLPIFELNLGNGDNDSLLEKRTGVSRSLDTWERIARGGEVESKRRFDRDELEMIPRRRSKVSVGFKTAHGCVYMCIMNSDSSYRLCI